MYVHSILLLLQLVANYRERFILGTIDFLYLVLSYWASGGYYIGITFTKSTQYYKDQD